MEGLLKSIKTGRLEVESPVRLVATVRVRNDVSLGWLWENCSEDEGR